MSDPDNTIFVDFEPGREHHYTLIATPEAIRSLVDSLSASLAALPTPLQDARELSLDGLLVADADGGRREVYLSVRAVPSLAWLQVRRGRTLKRDWVVTLLLLGVAAFAIFGIGTFVRWLLAHAA